MPIEQWMALVLARTVRHRGAVRHIRALRLRVSTGFVWVAAMLGVAHGFVGAITTFVALSSVVAVHEVTRALLASLLGRSSLITLSAAGGETEFEGPPPTRVETLADTLVGSLGNALFALAIAALARSSFAGHAAAVLEALAYSHAAWAGMHLLPVIPSRLSRLLTRRFWPASRFAYASASVAFAFVFGEVLLTVLHSGVVMGLLGLWLVGGIREARDAYRESADERAGCGVLLEQANAELGVGANTDAIALLRKGLAFARSRRQRGALYKSLAWAAIGQHDGFLLSTALLALSEEQLDLPLLAATLACWDRDDEALALLEQARRLGQRSRATTRQLIDLYFQTGRRNAALDLACADRDLLSAEDGLAIDAALSAAE